MRKACDSIITIDSSYSSKLCDVKSRPPEPAPVYLASEESLKLRIFIDKSVVEAIKIKKKQVIITGIHWLFIEYIYYDKIFKL